MNGSDQPQVIQGAKFFKWVCLGVGVTFGFILLWMIADFKRKMVVSLDQAEATVGQVQQSVEKVNANMPAVLKEIRETSRTLARVADDVELMKRVAGISSEDEQRGVRGLAIYADELQQILADESEGKGAIILVEEVVGSDLKEVESVAEFLVGLNKEMILTVLPFSKSRQEVLYRVCRSGIRRKPFYIQFDNAEPVLLKEFICQHHPASRELPEYKIEK